MFCKIMYILVSVLWGCFSLKVTEQLFPKNPVWKKIVVFIVNSVICPISLLVAIIRFKKWCYIGTYSSRTNINFTL